jgi:hypothetical protein
MASTIHLLEKFCVAKCEEENGQIIIIQGIAMKKLCSVQYNKTIVKKIKLKHQNLTSQILPVCLPLKADVLAVSVEKYRVLMFIRGYRVR